MALAERRIWLNGELVPWGQATLHVLSQSAQRGSLVFDVMHCYWNATGPVILGLREHVARFENSASLSEMFLPIKREAILAAIGQTVRANPDCQIVKISAYYPGVALDVVPTDPAPSIAIAAFALRELLPAGKSGSLGPRKLKIADPRKIPPWVISPQLKLAAGYLYTSIAKRRAQQAGFDDVLLLDERGEVAESSTQSLFLVFDGVIHAPPLAYVLAGITRRVVLELAEDDGISCKEQPIPGDRLKLAGEAFMAATTTNIWPVSQIDDLSLPDPVPGIVTARLMARFAVLVSGEDGTFSSRWMQPV